MTFAWIHLSTWFFFNAYDYKYLASTYLGHSTTFTQFSAYAITNNKNTIQISTNTFGAFDLVGEEMEDDLYLLHHEDILAYLDLSSLVRVSVQDNKIMERELKVSDMECLPSPETPATASGAKRFCFRIRVKRVSGCKTIHFNN